MPSTGVTKVARGELLSWEEMHRLCAILTKLGVRKIRLTGGEPLARRGVLDFLDRLTGLATRDGTPELLLTTNGTLLEANLDRLWDVGIRRLNISIDSLRPAVWSTITRRDGFDRVWRAIEAASERGFALKLNTVVLPGINDSEIPDFVGLTETRDWTVRFIEPMPFDGRSGCPTRLAAGDEILETIRSRFDLNRVENAAAAVDECYRVPGFAGQVGIIRGHSRTFCANCSRLRVSARGQLRTCLYGRPVLDMKADLRLGKNDRQLAQRIVGAVGRRYSDGLAAQRDLLRGELASMSEIGG